MTESAQVVLREEPADRMFALTCHSAEAQDLLCDLPRRSRESEQSALSGIWNVKVQQAGFSEGARAFHGISANTVIQSHWTPELVYDPSYEIRPVVTDSGEISNWELRMAMKNLKFPISLKLGDTNTAVACECAAKYGKLTGNGVVPCSPKAVKRDPNAFQEDDYVVCEEGKPVGIDMYLLPDDVARNWSKCHITVRSNLNAGENDRELVAELPDIAPEIRPKNFSAISSETPGFFKISGDNLQAIKEVYLWDCGQSRVPVIHSKDAIYFPSPKAVTKPCPVTLLMGKEPDPSRKRVCDQDSVLCIEPLGPDGRQLRLLPAARVSARRSGIHRVILPMGNKKDFRDLPAHVRQEMQFHFVERVEEVLALVIPNIQRR